MLKVDPLQWLAQLCPAFLLLNLATDSSGRGQEVMPNSSRECAICHIRWVQAFDRAGSQKGSMQAIMDRKAGSGDMCLSCHDGSVVDSRFKIWSTRHHTTDSVPSAAVKIPTDIFPLDAQGRMTCATCHTAHAVAESSDLRTVIFLRRPNVDSSLCLSCHPEHAEKNEFQHPLGQSDSPVPDVILQAGGKASGNGHGIICQTCHEPHGARNAWMLVLPPSELCIACHTEKSPEAAAPAGMPMHRIGQTYTGFKPPATLLSQNGTFGPNGELTCLSCHRLHDASGARPLLIRPREGSSLCLECHTREQAVIGSPHDLRISSPQTANARGEMASESGPCGACHRIHGWARDVPETGRSHSSGCMECHQTGGPGSSHRPYGEAHPVGVPVPGGPSIPLPLDADTGTIGCLTCHDPHTPRAVGAGGAVARPSSEETGSRVQAPRSFLRMEGSQLCVVCHGEVSHSLEGPHNPAEFAPATREALGVRPSAGSCRLCHTTHNAQGPHLWARAPKNTSAGPVSRLCGACHDEGPADGPGGTHHLLAAISSLQGLSGSLLQNTLLRTGVDGELGCVTCHDPHDGPSAGAQVRDASGGICTECHRDKAGVRGSVHDAGAGQWAEEAGFISKGLCIDCHPIHGRPEDHGLRRLLGHKGGPGELCEDCHRAGPPGPGAKAESPMHDSILGGPTPHMGRLLIHDPNWIAGELPTDSAGRIVCTSCHDIHQAAQPPKLIRAVGREDIPNVIHHTGEPVSDLCLVCHPDMERLLGTPHDLRTSAPETTNAHGQTPDESGPCLACHLIHPRSPGGSSWARSTISGADFGREYCTGCHRDGECGQGRIPMLTDHPDVPLLNRQSPGEPGYMPTFDNLGERSRTGAISCLTCHEPHMAESAQAEPGLDRMFLRPSSHQSLCADCHGIEAPWRFLYYHQTRRNPYRKTDPGWLSGEKGASRQPELHTGGQSRRAYRKH